MPTRTLMLLCPLLLLYTYTTSHSSLQQTRVFTEEGDQEGWDEDLKRNKEREREREREEREREEREREERDDNILPTHMYESVEHRIDMDSPLHTKDMEDASLARRASPRGLLTPTGRKVDIDVVSGSDSRGDSDNIMDQKPDPTPHIKPVYSPESIASSSRIAPSPSETQARPDRPNLSINRIGDEEGDQGDLHPIALPQYASDVATTPINTPSDSKLQYGDKPVAPMRQLSKLKIALPNLNHSPKMQAASAKMRKQVPPYLPLHPYTLTPLHPYTLTPLQPPSLL